MAILRPFPTSHKIVEKVGDPSRPPKVLQVGVFIGAKDDFRPLSCRPTKSLEKRTPSKSAPDAGGTGIGSAVNFIVNGDTDV